MLAAGFKSFLRSRPLGRQYQAPARLQVFSVVRFLPLTAVIALRQRCSFHQTCCAICERSHPRCHADGIDRQRGLRLGLPQDSNNLFFGESATFHSCAPMSGTLTFQWHTFRGEGHAHPSSRSSFPNPLRARAQFRLSPSGKKSGGPPIGLQNSQQLLTIPLNRCAPNSKATTAPQRHI